jgi:hypothetical protein
VILGVLLRRKDVAAVGEGAPATAQI